MANLCFLFWKSVLLETSYGKETQYNYTDWLYPSEGPVKLTIEVNGGISLSR